MWGKIRKRRVGCQTPLDKTTSHYMTTREPFFRKIKADTERTIDDVRVPGSPLIRQKADRDEPEQQVDEQVGHGALQKIVFHDVVQTESLVHGNRYVLALSVGLVIVRHLHLPQMCVDDAEAGVLVIASRRRSSRHAAQQEMKIAGTRLPTVSASAEETKIILSMYTLC